MYVPVIYYLCEDSGEGKAELKRGQSKLSEFSFSKVEEEMKYLMNGSRLLMRSKRRAYLFLLKNITGEVCLLL